VLVVLGTLMLDGALENTTVLALVAVLSALAAAARVLSTGVGGFELIFVVVILAGRALGARLGFIVGVLAVLLSSFVWGGFGPWTAFQMFGVGWVAAGAGLIPRLPSPSVASQHREVAVLVANCPVCHQTLSLVARYLEANGISTVLMGCAKDIPEYCGVPRFLFSDFPLGNAGGKPHDLASQQQTLGLALDLLETAFVARSTVQSPQCWPGDSIWKLDYSNPDRTPTQELVRLRAAADAAKAEVARLKSLMKPA
jgi:hypothetical protein